MNHCEECGVEIPDEDDVCEACLIAWEQRLDSDPFIVPLLKAYFAKRREEETKMRFLATLPRNHPDMN